MEGKRGWRIWLAAALFSVALAAVICAGVSSMPESAAVGSAEIQRDPIAEFRTLRQQLRAMQKAQLNEVAHDPSNDDELIAMAQRQLLELCTREEQELTLEGILSMRGWTDPVVTVHQDSVNVLLQSEIITQQESSMILELVCRETGVMSGNVKIIPIK